MIVEKCLNTALSKGLYSDINKVLEIHEMLVRFKTKKYQIEDLERLKRFISEILAGGCVHNIDAACVIIEAFQTLFEDLKSRETSVDKLD